MKQIPGAFQYLPSKNIEFYFLIGNESRIWYAPKSKTSKFDETFVDQLYFKWKNVVKLPLELTIGRQNIMLDEGFICFDGQPLTGSRSAYFNAIKSSYSFNAQIISQHLYHMFLQQIICYLCLMNVILLNFSKSKPIQA